MNLVVISAAFSSANTNLYTTSRMLFSLARSGFAPAQLARVGPSGVPRLAVTTASAGMVTAILLAIYSPGRAFLALYGIAVAGMLFVWTVILFTYLAFRRSLSPAQVEALPIRLPAHRLAAWCGIMSLTGIMITTLFVDGLRYTVPSFLPFLVIMSLVYIRTRPRATTI
jgi:L-asparagine transporter-like permease